MLGAIQVRSVVYCRSELGAPWGFRVSHSPQAKFHLILGGTAILSVEGAEDLPLKENDLVLLPKGTEHIMRDRASSRVRHLERILKDHPADDEGTIHYGGRGAKTLLVCGAFDTPSSTEVLSWLPPTLVVDAATNGLGRWLEPMIELVQNQGEARPGDAAVMSKVADVFLTDTLRHFLATSADPADLAGLSAISEDRAIAEALALMRARCDEPWTLASLSREVGMSRSSFVARFHAAMGAAPLTYFTRLRLARAAGTLATSTRALCEVARAAGYDSESSFSKAFVRQFGTPPGQYRREHRHFLRPGV
jgi:AraC-like DNA-binding protein/mannose-6-phosphate isomerase-like protein (cupin superfamily)